MNLEQMFSLKGKTAFITGAAGAIGGAISEGLWAAGAHVALTDINMERLVKFKEKLGERADAFKLDMSDMASFDPVVADIAKINGRIDILINCAGTNKREGVADVEEATYDRIIQINLKSAFFLSQAVAPYMKEQKGGSIINIGSHNTGMILGGCSVYGISKAGLVSLTRSIAVEWAKYNIRANCVSPGHIRTELTAPLWDHPGRSKYLLDRIALNRSGTSEDISGLVVALCADSCSYITGQEFRIDGGFFAGGQPWEYDTKF
ncbi:MAG: SDR family oxidoreductase [Oscillospiraceae bacterium]|nr:SDR family oxidoreductase [Oscillospiraceae bacterium]